MFVYYMYMLFVCLFVLYALTAPACGLRLSVIKFVLFVLRFYSPVNPMGSCRAPSVYLTMHLLGRLSPLSV